MVLWPPLPQSTGSRHRELVVLRETKSKKNETASQPSDFCLVCRYARHILGLEVPLLVEGLPSMSWRRAGVGDGLQAPEPGPSFFFSLS